MPGTRRVVGAQATETRSTIERAARDLFLENGYGRTTIADRASAAGVAVETIYAAFGNKATHLHRAWDITVGGDDQNVVFHQRPDLLSERHEPDLAKRFALLGAFSTQLRPLSESHRSNSWCNQPRVPTLLRQRCWRR